MKLSVIHLALLSLIPASTAEKGIRTPTLKRESCLDGEAYDNLVVDLENNDLIEDIYPLVENGDQIHAWRRTAVGDAVVNPPQLAPAVVEQPSLTQDLYQEVLAYRADTYLDRGAPVVWSGEDREAAQHEGWDVFLTDRGKFDRFDIQALDDPVEGGAALTGRDADNQAWEIVLRGALNRNPRHLRALAFLLENGPIELWRILHYGATVDAIPVDEPEVCLYVGVQLRLAVSFLVDRTLATAASDEALRSAVADAIEERIAAAGGLRAWLLQEQLVDLDNVTLDDVGTP